ncbi:MAG TPA: hypothetical protein VLH15_04695, partial [Dehalococcoidales bacterium]|nr:hypothetical protein [Dehalococcoidales bacterium]
LVKTGVGREPGINGAIKPRFDSQVSTVNIIGVDAIDLTLDKIRKWGGREITSKCLIPQVGWLAYCQDSEGNTFGVIQNIIDDG